jgi:hypothetical protein
LARRIITEADLLKMPVSAEVVIDNDTLITPAALDRAFTRGIQVVYRRSKTVSPGTETVKGSSRIAKRIAALRDGNYLLQVREGQFRIFEIRDDGVSRIP